MSTPHAPEEDRPARVLLIEDSALDRLWLRTRLRPDGLEIEEAADGLIGLEASFARPPDLILLDLNLPGLGGFEVLRRLKSDSRTSSIPVIVVSATSKPMEKACGLDLGAVDFITKPYDLVELRARIRVALRTRRIQEVFERRAHIDGLTGLANRMAMEERLLADWATVKRHGISLAVWLIDVDHFKRVNDDYGHAAGDEALRRTAALLHASIRATDLAARYGGEEFVVIAPYCDMTGALKTAERFRERLASTPMPLGDTVARVTASIGVASVPGHGIGSPAELFAEADKALYEAKAMGRNRVNSRPRGPELEPESQLVETLAIK